MPFKQTPDPAQKGYGIMLQLSWGQPVLLAQGAHLPLLLNFLSQGLPDSGEMISLLLKTGVALSPSVVSFQTNI